MAEDIADNDLYLRASRRKPMRWEVRPSPRRFRQPLRVASAGFGRIYVQGVVTDWAGREMVLDEVVHLIESSGHAAVNQLGGSFVIAVDDANKGVWCATDYSATVPLYYKLAADELVVTTRAENLTLSGADDLDPEGIAAFLNSGYPWGDLTLLKSWKVLRPGQILRIDAGDRSEVSYYFDPEADESVEGFHGPEEFISEIDAELASIADRHAGPLLIPLSGGVDSRMIAVRCHKLGIPFEAITFVANVLDGDDFDIASRLAKVLGIKHHRWEWNPSAENCTSNFKRLCIESGGTNDAFTSYPDGMDYFAGIAAHFPCVLRGDHAIGFGPHSESLFESGQMLNLNYRDDLDRIWNASYGGDRVSMHAVFAKQHDVVEGIEGPEVDPWRHKSYRKNRNPRFTLTIAQLQAQVTEVGFPLHSKRMVQRISRTDVAYRNNKTLAREALALASSREVNAIPTSVQSTWLGGEPLLNLPDAVVREMVDFVRRPGVLSDVIDEQGIADRYLSFLSQAEQGSGRRIRHGLKQFIRGLLPKSVIRAYQGSVSRSRVAPHMLFKRYFAMKAYIDSISGIV